MQESLEASQEPVSAGAASMFGKFAKSVRGLRLRGNQSGANKYGRMGDILLKQGVISRAQLDTAIREQAASGEKLGAILVSHDFASHAQLSIALRRQHKYMAASVVLLLQAAGLAFNPMQTASAKKLAPTQEQHQIDQAFHPSENARLHGLSHSITSAPVLANRPPLTSATPEQATREKFEPVELPANVAGKVERCMPHVLKAAKRFDVSPGLILAMIHTESRFKPRARSSMNAHGLMQIVPKFAGKEAYPSVFKKAGKPSLKQLRDPATNVMLGAAYLKRLETVYFRNIANEQVRQAAVIAAYNMGPTKLRNIFKRHGKPASVSLLKRALAEHAPKETQNYLDKVSRLKAIYGAAYASGQLLASSDSESGAGLSTG